MTFKTEIVQTKIIKPWLISLLIIPMLIYLPVMFIFDKTPTTRLLGVVASFSQALFFILYFRENVIKPKVIGEFNLSDTNLSFTINGETTDIPIQDLSELNLSYIGYGGWARTTRHGNKNYISLVTNSGKSYKFEILIKNKEAKDDFKAILSSPNYDEKFDWTPSKRPKVAIKF